MFDKMCEHSNGWRPEDGVPDLAMMSDITAEGINVNLRTRYQRDEIYTFSGSILIAVNPYKSLDIYNDQWISRYREQRLDQSDPHIFALTEAMYMNLVTQDLSNNTIELLEKQAGSVQQAAKSQSSKTLLASEQSSSSASAQVHSPLTTAIGFKNQACVISGESGAGKTETTKFILSYLCTVTPNKSVWMEHQILEANTILEAFGNAKTVRNDNSSRFGKFIQICFDSRHQINGCIIQDYLLEQSRITYQSIGERNYHVFYQLLAAGQANQELRQRFHLMPANFFNYLNKTKCFTIDGVSDCAMFDSLRTAMSVLNMDNESCDGLFSVLSAVLWLGNLQFESDENDECRFAHQDQAILDVISELLGIERSKLEPIMLRRQINVRGSITEIPFNLLEARDNRNGMAKALYSRLFTWVVNFINASTNPGTDNTCFLGVLDIFGFENFETNSFEQLCINYANEKLHKFFNQHMFAMEQELYKREGIEFCDINYTDNTPCLELLERPPNCILRLLSEECRMPKGNDGTLIGKMHTEFTSINPNPFYIKGLDKRNWSSEFSVRHFAGSVTYTVDGFLRKNKDSQQSQLFGIVETSTNLLLNDMVQCESLRDSMSTNFHDSSQVVSMSRMARHGSIDSQAHLPIESQFALANHQVSMAAKPRLPTQKSFCSSTSNNNNLRRGSAFALEPSRQAANSSNSLTSKSKPTVADAFRHQLSSLVDLLSRVNPWYVRCIKPNLEKSALGYDDRQVLMQLKYLGMSDLIRIRREGYPIHLTKHQFVCRYRCLMLRYLRLNPGTNPICLDEKTLHDCCSRMINHFKLDAKHWRIGKTMVLLRSLVYQPLEERRNALFAEAATTIQSCWRANVARKHYSQLRSAATRIQQTFRAYKGRLIYLRKKRAALTIQAFCRGMFARETANALREIKRIEQEKIRTAEIERRRKEEQQQIETEGLKICEEASSLCNQTEILITEAPNDGHQLAESLANSNQQQSSLRGDVSSPCSNISPLASSASLVGQDASEARQNLINHRDKKEMEELIKVLERHGISLDELEKGNERVYADFERLYDVLGSQINNACDTHSMSTSVNDDDKCSFVTTGTNGDGDIVSCSGQSQISSTVSDEQNTGDHEQPICNQQILGQDLVSNHEPMTLNNETHDAQMQNEPEYQSNSVESIASIVSCSNSTQLAATPQKQANSGVCEMRDEADEHASASIGQHPQAHPQHQLQMLSAQQRTSTFTGNPVIMSGSRVVANGRPLTRIEEEPNSIASSPSKTPCKLRPQGNILAQSTLDPLSEDGSRTPIQDSDAKRRRIERRIQQVQQEQSQACINPTTAGVLASQSKQTDQNNSSLQQSRLNQATDAQDQDIEALYGVQKANILDYAQKNFNNHPRDTLTSGTMIRTLTRRRRSVDTSANEFLSKAEMLSYNSTYSIPTSHIKMHDPHNTQISCSIFKNLCKYMTGDSAKSDTEIRIIQSIVRNGIEKSELRDEIYIQIIRQLTNNQNNEYCARLWTLLGLVSASFPASKSFSKHLCEYLKSKPRKDPSVTCNAQFCIDNLQAQRLGARKLPPSPLEIQAFKSLSTMSCKVYLLDGRCEVLSMHPCDTALDTMTKLAQKINLSSIEGWALYESYTCGASKYAHPAYEQRGDFERTVKPSSFMADLLASWQDGMPKSSSMSTKIIQKRLDEGNFRLTFKKKIFRGPRIRDDPVEISLLYAQAVYNVVKRDCFYVDESLAIGLAGIQAQIKIGNASDVLKPQAEGNKRSKSAKSSNKTAIVKSPAQLYEVEDYICLRLRNQLSKSKKEWCNLIYQAHKQLHGVNEVFCKVHYLSRVIHHCPLYGTATFDVTYKGYQALDQNLMLGVNAVGLMLVRATDKALMSLYTYNDICLDTGVTVYLDEKLIQFNVRDRSSSTVRCLTFESAENEEIASLMVSYSPTLPVHIRGPPGMSDFVLDAYVDHTASKKRVKLKMTLEDRMRTHQEVQNARRSIIKSGKLRKPNISDEHNSSVLRHTLRRLSSSARAKAEKPTRFENIYGVLGKTINARPKIPQASSDYSIYGSKTTTTTSVRCEPELENPATEVAGSTAASQLDEITRPYPHAYWAYTKYSLKTSLLTIYDPDLEEAALQNFNGILTYSGLMTQPTSRLEVTSASSTLDSSIDSGISSQQSLSNANGKPANGSPSSVSSNEIYDVCPKKLDERELIKLAQGILDKCLKKDADILKNEFFLQLIKQTTDHPDPNSEINKRHWQLLVLACSVTFPSDSKILSYLYAHLRRCSLDQVSDEGQYAQFSLRYLQGTLDTKGRKYAPSEVEILSTINCRRVYARVYFLDGQFQAVEFDPCATIAEVVDQIKQKVGLGQECTGYALFQPLDEDCEQVLRPCEKVGDAISAWEAWHKQKQSREIIQQSNSNNQSSALTAGVNAINKASIASLNANPRAKTHKFVFKKYLFPDNLMDLNHDIERELLYYQTVSSIKENKFPILEQEATVLCALKAQIEIGDHTKMDNLPKEHVRMIYKQVVMSLMPPHAFNDIQVQSIAQLHQGFKGLNRDDAKKYFFNLIQSFGRANFANGPGCVLIHRSHVYDAKQTFATAWPSDIWIVISHSGLHMLVPNSRRILASCDYQHIIDYNSSNGNLIIIVMSSNQSRVKYGFYSKQAQQITQHMKDYIAKNTTNSKGDKSRKSVGFNLK